MFAKILPLLKNKHFLSLAGNIIMSGMGMLTAAIIYRKLSLDDAGVWVIFQTAILFVDTFRSGFITTAFIKFYAGAEPQRATEIVGSTWYIALCITGGFILLNLPVLFFLHLIGDSGYVLFFKYFGITYILSLPWFIATCVQQGEQRFDRLLYIRFVNQGSFILFIVILLIVGQARLHTVLYAYLASHALTSLYALSMGWARAKTLFKRTKEGIADMFNFGKYSVGTTLSANMFRFSDVFIINAMLGTAPVAIYNLGQTLMQLVEIPLRSFAATGMPSLSAAYNQGSKIGVIQIMQKYIGLLTLVLLPATLVAVVLADVPIYIIGGGKYVGTEAANVFRLFMTFALLYPADRFFALTLDVIHQPKINFYKVLVMLAGNIIFDVLGVLLFKNVYGIALATVVPVLIGTAVGYWALNRYQPFNFFGVFTAGVPEAKLYLNQLRQRFKR